MTNAELQQEFIAAMERIRASSGSLSVTCLEVAGNLSVFLRDVRVPEGPDVTGEAPPELQALVERVRNTADVVEALTAKISSALDGLTKDAPSFN